MQTNTTAFPVKAFAGWAAIFIGWQILYTTITTIGSGEFALDGPPLAGMMLFLIGFCVGARAVKRS